MGRRVILVDDDPAMLSAMELLLTDWGLSVVPCASFDAGRVALTSSPPADALIVDIRLGTFNGLHLAHLAKQINPKMCVVADSGFDDPVLQAEAQSIGAQLLLKPIDSTELRRHLSTVLAASEDECPQRAR